MRLQLRTLAAGLLGLAMAAWPTGATADEHFVGVRTDVYGDEWIIVLSPAARARANIADSVELEGGLALDVLSGSTPLLATDAMTSATYFSEVRRDAHLSIKYARESTWDAGVAGAVSIEPDHITMNATASGRVEAFQRMTTFAGSYSFLHERVGTVHDPNTWALTLGHLANLSISQIVTRTTNLTGLLSGQYTTCAERLGCQANPYRAVPMVGDDGSIVVTAMERHPDRRARGAAALRLHQYLGHGLGFQAGYRFYADTWKVMAHTGDAALVASLFSRSFTVRAEGRFTWQDTASFFRGTYETDAGDPTVPEYRSGDRELARMFNVLAGARAEYTLPATGPIRLHVNSRLSRVWYRYLNYSPLPRRNAWLMGVGINGEF